MYFYNGDSFFSKTLDMKFVFFLIYSSSIQKIQDSSFNLLSRSALISHRP
ncbi:hypothetical protein Hdeb2414_s0001g00012581 [Helianthus debilis subsp. tardiflorus]